MIYISLTVYLLSAFGAWWYTSKAYYHPKGKFYGNQLLGIEWVGVLVPGLNTMNLIYLMVSWEDPMSNKDKLWKTKW